jgi:EpsI family protein
LTLAVRLLAVAAGFLLPLAALAGWLLLREPAASPPGLAPFPRVVGPWTLEEVDALRGEEAAMLAPDSYLAWRFAAEGRLPVDLYVALYNGRPADGGSGAHDPALCYPASGWEVTGTRSVAVAPAGGVVFPGRLLTAHLGRFERKTLYWFQPAARWPGSPLWEQFARVLDSLRGYSQFAFVRISVPVDGEGDAERDLLEFAGEIGWPVRLALSSEAERPLADARD